LSAREKRIGRGGSPSVYPGRDPDPFRKEGRDVMLCQGGKKKKKGKTS